MHYSVIELKDLKAIFPEPVANEMNFVLFSTSGAHGSYCTIEAIENDPDLDEVTVLVVHPRTVVLRYGNVKVTPESAPYLKALRQSSWEVMQRIGKPESDSFR
jgi:hypothetical protein